MEDPGQPARGTPLACAPFARTLSWLTLLRRAGCSPDVRTSGLEGAMAHEFPGFGKVTVPTTSTAMDPISE